MLPMRKYLAWFVTFGLIVVGTGATAQVRTESISNSKKGYWNASATYPVFLERTAIKKLASDAFRIDAETNLNEFVRYAKEFADSGQKPIAPWEFSQSSVVSINSATLVSGYSQEFNYSGGAHPNRFFRTINIGNVNGTVKKLVLKDFVKEQEDLEEFGIENIVPELNRLKRAKGIDEIVYSVDEKLLDNFVITPAGITWIFSPYEVGAYVEGEYFVKVPWQKLMHELKPNSVVSNLANAAASSVLTELRIVWLGDSLLPANSIIEFSLLDKNATVLQVQRFPISEQNQLFKLLWDKSKFVSQSKHLIFTKIFVSGAATYKSIEGLAVTVNGLKKVTNVPLVPFKQN